MVKGSIHISKIKLYGLYFCSDIFYFRGNHNHVINYSSFFSAFKNHSFANFHHGIENLRCGRFLHDFLCFRVFFYSESLKNFNCKKGSIGEMTSLHSGKITDESEPLSEESFENYAIFRRIFMIAGLKANQFFQI